MADDEILRRLEQLENDQKDLKKALEASTQSLEEAKQARDTYHRLYLEMMERCRKLERGLVGQQSERVVDNGAQLSLQIMDLMLDARDRVAIESLPEAEVKAHTRAKRGGRKPIPDELPRVDIEVLPEEVRREGLDAFEKIGEEVTEVVERRPASLVVACVIKPKFVRKDREREATKVHVGSTPGLPIERGLAGPGLLADTIVRRWQDHLPLHRLESVYARDRLPLARSTICGWHGQLTPLVEPLIAAMRTDAFEAPFICTDATGVLVQAKEKCRRGHFWVLVAPGKHVLFEYTRNHTAQAVDSILAGYEGYLVADAHVVYDHLYERENIVEVNCRVGGEVTLPAPHRPGRAELPHPVPHVAGSLGAVYRCTTRGLGKGYRRSRSAMVFDHPRRPRVR